MAYTFYTKNVMCWELYKNFSVVLNFGIKV